MLKSKHLIFLSSNQIIQYFVLSNEHQTLLKSLQVCLCRCFRNNLAFISNTHLRRHETIRSHARAWNKISAIITCSKVGFTWFETRLVSALCLRSPRVRKRSTPLIIIQGGKSRGEGSLLWGRTTVALPGIPGPRITIWRVQGEGRVKWPPAVG